MTVRGPHGIETAQVESAERWEREKITEPDGSIFEIEPVFCRLRLTLAGGRTFEVGERDFFECLLTVRKRLEAKGLSLCIQGARQTVWASHMSRDMGLGWYAALLESALGTRTWIPFASSIQPPALR